MRLAGVGEGDAVVRRRVPLAELERAPGDADVLAALADGRLVIVGREEAEVAHEALLREWPRLRGWLEEDVDGRRLHHHLGVAAREWDAGGRDPGELYRGARLAAALDWSAAHEEELEGVERAFVDESRAASERSHRRLRAVLAGVGALLVLAVVAGLVALDQRGSARDQATAADAQRLGSRALAENDLDRSLLLARQGVALDDSAQTRGNLLAALIKSPAAIGVMRGAGERFSALALSPDERTLAAGDPAGNVFLFDTRTRRRVTRARRAPGRLVDHPARLQPGRPPARHRARQPDGDVVTLMDTRTRRSGRASSSTTPAARHRDAVRRRRRRSTSPAARAGPRQRRARIVERFDAPAAGGACSVRSCSAAQRSPLLGTRDGRRVLTVAGEALVVRDARTLTPVQARRDRLRGAASAIALGPDDRTVAVGGSDGSVRFVDLRTGAVRGASGRHGGAVTGTQFTPDGRSLVTTSEDGDAIVWDVRRRRGGRDAVRATPTGSRRCRSPATAGRSTPPGSTARSSCGTSPARGGSAGPIEAGAPNRAVGAEPRRPAAGDRPRRTGRSPWSTSIGPVAAATLRRRPGSAAR